MRLDVLLVERGLAPNRSRAKALIMAGRVEVEGRPVDKAGTSVETAARIRILDPDRQDVGRGAGKLRGALDAFPVDVGGRTALDVGASTGGFTQVLLEAGAACVVALDVGKGQLDWGLRNDPRVRPLEGLNARYLEPSDLPTDLPGPPTLAVVDVSFISLRKVLPAVTRCLRAPGELVVLVKPQFEAGRGRVGKGGIVRDPEVHREVLAGLIEWISAGGSGAPDDLVVRDLCASPVEGAGGNREFFAWLTRTASEHGHETDHDRLTRKVLQVTASEGS